MDSIKNFCNLAAGCREVNLVHGLAAEVRQARDIGRSGAFAFVLLSLITEVAAVVMVFVNVFTTLARAGHAGWNGSSIIGALKEGLKGEAYLIATAVSFPVLAIFSIGVAEALPVRVPVNAEPVQVPLPTRGGHSLGGAIATSLGEVQRLRDQALQGQAESS